MKNILIFISGFVVGVCTAIVVALYHDIMSMQPQPVVDEGIDYDAIADGLGDALWKAHTVALGEALKVLHPLDDTQPVYVDPDDIGGM